MEGVRENLTSVQNVDQYTTQSAAKRDLFGQVNKQSRAPYAAWKYSDANGNVTVLRFKPIARVLPFFPVSSPNSPDFPRAYVHAGGSDEEMFPHLRDRARALVLSPPPSPLFHLSPSPHCTF